MKTCTLCGETKALSEFYYVRTRDTYYGRCKECRRQREREKHAAEGLRRISPRLSLVERLNYYGWKVTDTDCWEWLGPVTPEGYGEIGYFGKKHYRVHRAAYEVWVGPIPDGKQINHHCDNPPCINPEHLYAGTHEENMRDVDERKRRRYNETHTNTKLSQEDIREIKKIYSEGLLTQYMLAELYGSSQSHISSIIRGNKRRYVDAN